MKVPDFFPLSLLLLLSLMSPARAESPEEKNRLTFHLENDAIAGTDRYYTGGVRLTWTRLLVDRSNRTDIHPPRWDYPVIRQSPLVAKPGYRRARSLGLALTIFTPKDLERRELIEDDRPYAGYLFFSLGFHGTSSRHSDTLEFDVGIVGPHSYAEQVQRVVHDWFGEDDPNGWDNQLEDELGLEIVYERKWQLLQLESNNGFGFDIIPHLGGRLGNIHIYANTGLELRLGWHVPRDFGTCPIRPGCGSNPVHDELAARSFRYTRLGFHVFAALDGRAVARDIFLDGNTFADSHSVDKNPFVADLIAGFGLSSRRLKITYAHIYRTKEFDQQDEPSQFGSLTLSYAL